MSANFSGSWMTTFSVSRLAQIAGVTVDAWPVAASRAPDNHAFKFHSSVPSRTIEVIADDHAPHGIVFPHPGRSKQAHVVLSEELFRGALVRERKRADRFDQVFALITIEALRPQDAEVRAVLAAAATSVAGATRETDVVGWLETDRVLAVMMPEIVAPAAEAASQIEARVIRDVVGRLGSSVVAALTIRLHVHSGLDATAAEGVSSADPLVAEIASARQRATTREGLKRVLDILLSATLLILLSPLLLVIAAVIRLTSSGPVLFRQVRIGEMARPFTMLKFRSMQAGAAAAIHQQFVTDFIKSSGEPKADGAETYKLQGDPRITRIGSLLRKTSLDELPQLWNVFRGDMSLVGPRPPLQYELEQYRSWHWRRVLEAKPGMTGLWQVKGRSRTTFDEMVRLDLRYVRARSLWTDVKILLATPRAVVTGKGAC